ncbi:MAG TPA: hypothetical protein VGH14_10265, partial [Solirubrobacterales bacterium]
MTETLTAADPITVAGTDTEPKAKTYRGKSLEELLPRIRADLGPEAVITSRREGLVGGIGGFFQKRCVEVDARPGGPRIDVYDEEPAMPTAPVMPSPEAVHAAAEAQVANSMPSEPTEQHPVRNDAATREGLATPQMQRLVGESKPFSDLLEEMAAAPAVEPRAPEPIGEGLPAPGAPRATTIVAEPEVVEEPEVEEPKRVSNLREGMVATGLG